VLAEAELSDATGVKDRAYQDGSHHEPVCLTAVTLMKPTGAPRRAVRFASRSTVNVAASFPTRTERKLYFPQE
jgi:hypothetical protein